MPKWILLAIIALAFLLRIIGISTYPVGLNPDEASFGYDAYSLLKTGRDQWGNSWPLSLHSFGDYKLPLYSYLSIPSVAFFGLNEFSTRLPNAFFGVLAILATYLLVSKVFKNRSFALLSALFLAISPWHISLSRGAFEANLTTFFLPFGVYLFYRGLTDAKWMVVSSFIFGINLFSYHSARLVTPLIVFVIILLKRKELDFRKNIIPIFIFGIFALTALLTMINGGSARGADIAIFNPTDRGEAIFERRYEGTILGLQDQLSRLFSNKYFYTFDQFIKNYLSYFSLQFLFSQGAAERTYGMISGIGVLYLIEIFFFFAAFLKIAKNNEWRKFLLFFIWILLAPIPAALTKGTGSAANRAAIMMPVLQIISAYGLLTLWSTFKSKILRLSVISLLALSLIFFLENYIYHAPNSSAPSMMYGRREMVETLKKLEPEYENIIVSRALSEPHIYFGFFNAWEPTDYQKQTQDWLRYKQEGRVFLDQLGRYSLGKYIFTDVDYSKNSKLTGILLVGKPEEFPQNINALETINFPNGKPAILIVDPKNTSYAKVK